MVTTGCRAFQLGLLLAFCKRWVDGEDGYPDCEESFVCADVFKATRPMLNQFRKPCYTRRERFRKLLQCPILGVASGFETGRRALPSDLSYINKDIVSFLA